jgi:ribosomal protein S18 acetylase RimI-like enzyme
MELRVLDAGDAAAFRTLRLAALRECPTAFSSSYEEECDIPVARTAERIAPGRDHAIFGAFERENLVGTVGLHRESSRKLAHKALIWGVYVAPSFRQRGVGRMLLQRALAHASSMSGLLQVTLGVNTENTAAIALYKSLGFETFGLERGFLLVDGVLHDELHMRAPSRDRATGPRQKLARHERETRRRSRSRSGRERPARWAVAAGCSSTRSSVFATKPKPRRRTDRKRT